MLELVFDLPWHLCVRKEVDLYHGQVVKVGAKELLFVYAFAGQCERVDRCLNLD